MISVRHATEEDWPAVATLLAELGRPAVLGSGDEPRALEVYRSYLRRTDTDALVAEEEDEIVGFVDVEYRARLNFLTEEAWIPDLVVTAGARSRGAGAALLARVEELARERACWSLTLESALWRERAHDFYRREGWKDTGLAFTKNLSSDGFQWPPAPRP